MKELVYWSDAGFYMEEGALIGQRIMMYFTEESIKVSETNLGTGLKNAMLGLFKGNKIKEEYKDVPEDLRFNIPYEEIEKVTTTNQFASGFALIITLNSGTEYTFTSSKMSEPNRFIKTIQYLGEFLNEKNSNIKLYLDHEDGYWET